MSHMTPQGVPRTCDLHKHVCTYDTTDVLGVQTGWTGQLSPILKRCLNKIRTVPCRALRAHSLLTNSITEHADLTAPAAGRWDACGGELPLQTRRSPPPGRTLKPVRSQVQMQREPGKTAVTSKASDTAPWSQGQGLGVRTPLRGCVRQEPPTNTLGRKPYEGNNLSCASEVPHIPSFASTAPRR